MVAPVATHICIPLPDKERLRNVGQVAVRDGGGWPWATMVLASLGNETVECLITVVLDRTLTPLVVKYRGYLFALREWVKVRVGLKGKTGTFHIYVF